MAALNNNLFYDPNLAAAAAQRKPCCSKPDRKTVNNILIGVGISLVLISIIAAVALNVFASYFILSVGLMVAGDILVTLLSMTGITMLAAGILRQCCPVKPPVRRMGYVGS